MYNPSHYMTIQIPFNDLERLLNSIEGHASGCYDVVSIVSLNTARSLVGVVIRFEIKETDPPFDEEEIKRMLGYE
jgi:hypothetical protein